MIDSAYAAYEEELPREAEFEEEFNIAISLVRTLITDSNKAQIKKKSNFYTLYGSCLRYYRENSRASFRRPDDISTEITRLLGITSLEEAEAHSAKFRRYFDAVTRAASDKGRRVEREAILYEIIRNVDAGLTQGFTDSLELFPSGIPDL
jgi:hypothetical protein